MTCLVLLLTLLLTLTSSISAATGTKSAPSKSTLAETCASQLQTPHAFRDLVSWVSSFPKYQVSGVEIRTGEDGDRGFFASREIPADDLLIRLPDSLFVHPGTMFTTPYWTQRWDIFQHAQLDNYTSMALRLFHEAYDYHEGSSSPVGDVPSGSCSPWLPWLRILPESFSTPPYMEESDFALMEELTPNSGHADTLRDLKTELESTYEHVITEIYDAYPELFIRRPTWEEFLRFHQAIQTRCWTNTTSVPFLEMFNHDGHANIPYFGEDDVTIHSHRMYAPGEQLYISYGQQSDWFTLLYYGFVSDRNPWNTRKFDVNLQLAMFPHLITAHDLSSELHFGDEGDYLPNNTLAVMRLYVLTQHDFIHHHKIHGEGILSMENEVTMLRALMEICNEQLSQHSTTIAQDEIRLKDTTLSHASHMILHYVIKQKRLLENVKQEIQQRWMNLLEYQV